LQSLLFLVHRIPYPPTKGDKVRSYNMLKYLARRYKMYVGAFVDDAADMAHEGALRELCEDCHLVRLNPAVSKIASLRGLITGDPLTLPYYHNGSMRHWVNDVLRKVPLQGVLVFSAAMAQYVMAASNFRRVADLVDVDSDKWRQYAASQYWPYSAIYRRESRTLLGYERRIAREFDSTVFVSESEAEFFRQLAPESAHKVQHINMGVDCDYFRPDCVYVNPYETGENVLVFTGAMDYWPNVDAVVAFAHEVFPKILAQNSTARFYIVGARPAPEVRKLAQLTGVKVTGSVPDIRPYLAHAKVAVAPLRLARGIQSKVLEAMAMAKPVIASLQAAEGIDAKAGTELMVAPDANAFVGHALSLMNGQVAAAVGAAGRARVIAAYSWESSLSKFDLLLSCTAEPVGDACLAPEQTRHAARVDTP
jgi:sugar transferase (PEP-CTERM/EpsH1 system associated)